MKKTNIIIAFLSIGLLLFSCSNNDSTDDNPNEPVIDCDKLEFTNIVDNKITRSIPEFPSSTIGDNIFSVTYTHNSLITFSSPELSIIDETPIGALQFTDGAGTDISSSMNIGVNNNSLFDSSERSMVTGKIQAKQDNCIETVDFEITIIPNNN